MDKKDLIKELVIKWILELKLLFLNLKTTKSTKLNNDILSIKRYILFKMYNLFKSIYNKFIFFTQSLWLSNDQIKLTNFDFDEFYNPLNETNLSTIIAELLKLINEEDSYASEFKRLKFDDSFDASNNEDLKVVGICTKSQKNVYVGIRSGLFYYKEEEDLKQSNKKKKYIHQLSNYPNKIEFFRNSIESIEFWLFNFKKEVNY